MMQLFGLFASDPAPVFFLGAPFFTAGIHVLLAILVFQRVMTTTESTACPPPRFKARGKADSST
jgi:hypothetical protein